MTDIYYAVAHRSQEEIDSFKTRYDEFNEEVIPAIFDKDLNLTVTNVKRSESWGSSHVIYYVQTQDKVNGKAREGALGQKNEELVFRANLGMNPQPEAVMLVEKLITDQVAEIGIPTNRVLHVDISRKNYSFDYQIQEKILGNDLEDHFQGTQEEYDAMSYELGALVGDPVLDLASCPTWRTHYPRKEQLLAGYQSVRQFPDHFQEKWDLYNLRTMLWKMVYAIRMDIVNDVRVERFKTSLAPFSL